MRGHYLNFDPLKKLSDQELQKGTIKQSSTIFADQNFFYPCRKRFNRRHVSDYPLSDLGTPQGCAIQCTQLNVQVLYLYTYTIVQQQ